MLSPCLFGEDFAWIAEGRDVPDEVALRCPSHGLARAVIYAVMAEEAGQPLHLGDTYSEEAAREVLRRLRFETGFYSRSWEISSAHLSEESHDFLAQRADGGIPDDLLYVAFRIPYRPAIGVQLIATPWTDANLLNLVGLTAAHLHRKQRRRGLPKSLVDVLHLAAQADVRLLIFDGDAPVLDGLPLFEW
ncbi:MAG: ABC transporter substrate-binding protein [Candidatus Accumulibacter sp.]|nr:ABC transporter substrate-binding protein [Accumulibacter sp.]